MSRSDVPVANLSRASYLDAARGLAILGVIGVHVSQHFKSGIAGIDGALFAGQFGVQLFFAISAYTMCLTLEQRISRDSRPFLAFFGAAFQSARTTNVGSDACVSRVCCRREHAFCQQEP